MAATTALVVRLAEFPEFVTMMRVKTERYKISRVAASAHFVLTN